MFNSSLTSTKTVQKGFPGEKWPQDKQTCSCDFLHLV